MGLSITALAAATTLGDTDLFEIEQPGVSKKLTKSQLATLLSPSPALFSGLSATTSVDDADLFVVEQAGVIMKLTRSQLVTLVTEGILTVDATILPQSGDVVYYDGANYFPGAPPRWRVVHQDAYTESAPASTSTITFAGGGPTGGINLKAGDYFAVGDPVRVVQLGPVDYYGICTAVSDTLLTINGATLKTWQNIVRLDVGTRDMVKHVQLCANSTSYPVKYPNRIVSGCQHLWQGATGYLTACSGAHMNTVSTNIVAVRHSNSSPEQIIHSGPAIGVTPGAGTATTYGAFYDVPLGAVQQLNSAITHNSLIRLDSTLAGGSSDYLIMCLTYVVP